MNKSKPAFPSKGDQGATFIGLTKYEYFAACALQGLLANPALVSNEEALKENDLKDFLASEAMKIAMILENKISNEVSR